MKAGHRGACASRSMSARRRNLNGRSVSEFMSSEAQSKLSTRWARPAYISDPLTNSSIKFGARIPKPFHVKVGEVNRLLNPSLTKQNDARSVQPSTEPTGRGLDVRVQESSLSTPFLYWACLVAGHHVIVEKVACTVRSACQPAITRAAPASREPQDS